MRSFASDNNSGVHSDVMDAIISANVDHAVGYGADEWTKMAEERIKREFGGKGDIFFVFNGTGANCVALQAATRSFDAIVATSTAHICVDECGAPSKMTGCRIFEIPTTDGKLTPKLIQEKMVGFGVEHHSQPRVVYISQVTELGTVYTIDEVKRLSDFLHKNNMYLHMDGARLANACAALGCSFADITVDAGVDILSFGGTKNGMMAGEAVISFREEMSQNLKYIRKQSAQLASKMRYFSAQFSAYLDNELWLKNAMHANSQAKKLSDAIALRRDVELTQAVESNAIFVKMPRHIIDKLLEKYFFYFWNENLNEVRFVTSWDTSDDDIADFIDTLNEL